MQRIVFIFILFSFFVKALQAQEIDVRIDQPIHDFGYIKEVDGKVYTEFEFVNHSSFPVTIIKTISSCGCAIASADDDEIAANGKGKIKVEYDPTGRPGKFVKSFEIQFVSDFSKKSVLINISGYTIEKELLDAYVENLYEGTELMIKPYQVEILSETDYRFLKEVGMQHFINDITYEIDQNGFANVLLEMEMRSTDEECKLSKIMYPLAHNFIIAELERRHYKSYMVGFTDNPCKDELKNTESGGILKISSRDFNNDTITESGFYFSGENEKESRFIFDRLKDSSDYSKQVVVEFDFLSVNDLNAETNQKFKEYVNLATRRILIDKKAYTGITIKATGHPESETMIRNKLLSSLNGFYTKVKSAVDDNGGTPDKIIFSIPDFEFVADDKLKKGKPGKLDYTFTLFHQVIDENFILNPFTNYLLTDSSDKKNLSGFIESAEFGSHFQNLPIFENKHNGTVFLDTAGLAFRTWFGILKAEIKKGKKIKLLVETGMGNSPFLSKSAVNGLAEKNSAYLINLLKKQMRIHSLPDSTLQIGEYFNSVNGMQYDSREFEVKFYDPYNFYKIIPVYNVDADTKTDWLIPYITHFNTKNFVLSENTANFQNFISRLIPELNKKGILKLTIESSVYEIPDPVFKNNEALALFRSEEAIKKIKLEIIKRGYDHSRIIFDNQFVLVKANGNIKETAKPINASDIDNYLKISPSELINK